MQSYFDSFKKNGQKLLEFLAKFDVIEQDSGRIIIQFNPNRTIYHPDTKAQDNIDTKQAAAPKKAPVIATPTAPSAPAQPVAIASASAPQQPTASIYPKLPPKTKPGSTPDIKDSKSSTKSLFTIFGEQVYSFYTSSKKPVDEKPVKNLYVPIDEKDDKPKKPQPSAAVNLNPAGTINTTASAPSAKDIDDETVNEVSVISPPGGL